MFLYSLHVHSYPTLTLSFFSINSGWEIDW
jgi:hypothetical protein